MWEILRKIGFVIAVLVLSASVYFIYYAEKEVQQNVLEYSLNLMGDKLLAMVPEGVDKEELSELYDGFKQRVISGLVEPEQVETMAANILNVSNAEESLTPQQAEGILRSGIMAPKSSSSALAPVELMPKAPIEAPEKPKPERWEIAGERVKVMFKFNERMQEVLNEHDVKITAIAPQMHYQTKGGLNLLVDTRLTKFVGEKEFIILAKEFKHLEQQDLLAWRENLSEELVREKEGMEVELEALQESLEELRSQHISEALIQLESLKSLENLAYIPVINADSVRKVVEKSLREAGIHPPYRESKNKEPEVSVP